MELHPVQQRVVNDRTRVGRPLAQGFPVSFPGPADVGQRNSAKGHQVHGVHLDLRRTDRVTAPLSDLRPPPETEGHGDAARYHLVPQLPAELHKTMLGWLPPGAAGSPEWKPASAGSSREGSRSPRN